MSEPRPIPVQHTRERIVEWWGGKYKVTPAVVDAIHGNGRVLLAFQPLNTRPDYYLIRVDSIRCRGDKIFDELDEIIELIIDQYGEIERERENIIEDLREQGIKPDGSNTDLDGNEDRLGWPVLSLDSGYTWWEKCRLRAVRIAA